MTTTLPQCDQAPVRPSVVEIPTQRPAPTGRGPVGQPSPERVAPRRVVAAKPVHPRRRWPVVVGGLAAGLAVGTAGAVGAAQATTTHTTPPAPPAAARQFVANVSVPGRVMTRFGDGTWQVGVDVEPGVYTTTGSTGSACHHALRATRTGGAGGGSAARSDRSTVVLTADAGWFETSGCATWTRVSAETA